MTWVTTSGCEIMMPWEPSISVMSALARWAISRTTSLPAAVSAVPTAAQTGRFFQAGGAYPDMSCLYAAVGGL
jgi:hypothetical protein